MRRATLTRSTTLVTLVLAATLVACGGGDEARPADGAGGPITSPLATVAAGQTETPAAGAEAPAVAGTAMPPMTITSPSFDEGQPIPSRYSCDGEDISPLLVLENVPEGTASLAFIVHDPDAPGGDWVHWVAYDVLVLGAIAEDVNALSSRFGVIGRNSWGRDDYGAPCPPSGTHRYIFEAYAVDVKLGLPPGASDEELRAALVGHVLGEATLMGTYTR